MATFSGQQTNPPFFSNVGCYIQNKMHINDWQSIQTLWDKLNKQLDKTQKVTGALGTPRPYIKILVELEDFLNKTLAGKIMIRVFYGVNDCFC